MFLGCLFLRRVHADVAPEPYEIIREPSVLPLILIAAAVIAALFLLKKFKKS